MSSSAANLPACAICQKPLGHVLPRTLYGYPVCPEDYQTFMFKRVGARLIDNFLYGIFFAMTFWAFFFLAAIIVSATTKGEIPDSTSDFIVRFWLLLIPLGVLGRTLLDGFRGHSPGKAMLGMQVIHEGDGRPAGFFDSFQRNLVLLIPFTPLIILIMLFQGDGHRWGDGWARTKVILKDYRHRPPFQSESELRAQTRARITSSISAPAAPTA